MDHQTLWYLVSLSTTGKLIKVMALEDLATVTIFCLIRRNREVEISV